MFVIINGVYCTGMTVEKVTDILDDSYDLHADKITAAPAGTIGNTLSSSSMTHSITTGFCREIAFSRAGPTSSHFVTRIASQPSPSETFTKSHEHSFRLVDLEQWDMDWVLVLVQRLEDQIKFVSILPEMCNSIQFFNDIRTRKFI